MISEILINGEVGDGRISVVDSSVLRGDGCFEVLKAYDGVPFAVLEHLDRLESSAAALDLVLPPREDLAAWVDRVSRGMGDSAVRIVVTRGSAIPDVPSEPQVIVFATSWPRLEGPARLMPVAAPWHSAGEDWALSGAKLLSDAPNLSATREAKADGYDDALLVGRGGWLLEGPTFAVAWLVDGILETPSLDLGILDSITRRYALDDARKLGYEVVEGRWQLDRLEDATEVMAMSTVREVQPVSQVGDLRFAEGAATSDISRVFNQRLFS